MKLDRTNVSIILAVAAVAWGTTLFFQGVPVGWNYLAPFGTTVGVVAGFGTWMEKQLWRLWPLRLLVKRPDLRGTWRVELRPMGQEGRVIVCYMAVKQTNSKLQMHLMTEESESWFIAESVCPSPREDGYRVAGVYENTPKLRHRSDGTSPMHMGSIVLHTHGPEHRPDSLTGEYWTDRQTAGEAVLSGRVDKVYSRFEDVPAVD